MLDAKLLRQNPQLVADKLAIRGINFDVAAFAALEEQRKAIQVKTEELQAQRNSKSKEIGQLKSKGEDAQAVMDEVAKIKQQLDESAEQLDDIQSKLNDILSGIPNIPHTSVPEGNSEEDNEEVRKWGEPKNVDFEP